MELVTLNDADYQSGKLIEGYDSLIWTERFNTTGDFQIITGDVAGFLSKLPEGKVVSLRDSDVPMVVERHEIETPDKGPDILTIKGRSFEKCLDQRASIQSIAAPTGSTAWVVNAKIPSDVAHYIIVKVCVEGIVDAKDIFPGTKIQFITPSDYLTGTGPTRAFEVPRGNLLNTVLTFLQSEAQADPTTTPATPAIIQHGIRSKRPAAGATAIGVEIYKGVDRRDQVYFDATRDLLKNGKYVFTKEGSANVGYGVLAATAAKMFKGAAEPSGFERRVILIDGSTSGATSSDILKTYMQTALAQARETALFNGSINNDISPYTFGVDYGLGDIVKVQGEYGLDELGRVTEYIRSQDKNGYRSYPTITTVDTNLLTP